METVKLVRSGADTQYKRANKQVSRQKHKLFLCDFFLLAHACIFENTANLLHSQLFSFETDAHACN